MTMRRVTSGVIPVPTGSTEEQITVHLLISSFMDQESQTPYQVNRVAEDGTKVQIRSGVLAVPAGGATRLVLEDVAGERIEVNLELESLLLEPSLSFIATARASNTSDLTEWVAPRAFTSLPAENGQPAGDASPQNVTTGIFPVDAAGNADTPAFTYEVLLFLSNFSDTAQVVMYTLNRLQAPLGAKHQVAGDQLTVEPGTVGQVTFSQLGGEEIEVNLTMVGDGLIPSVSVLRIDPDQQGTDLAFYLSPRDFVSVPG